jgi:hypothetical protein
VDRNLLAKLRARLNKKQSDISYPIANWAMEELLDHVDKLEARVAELSDEIDRSKPVPLCVSVHSAPVGYTCTMDSERCVVCIALEER